MCTARVNRGGGWSSGLGHTPPSIYHGCRRIAILLQNGGPLLSTKGTCLLFLSRLCSYAAAMATDTARDEIDDHALALGEKLRLLRQDSELTLQTLALAAGVSQSLISQVERGLTSPSITTLRRLAAALNVPVAAFFVGDHTTNTSEGDDKLDGQQIIVRSSDRKGLRVPRSNVVYELLTPDLTRKIEFLWIEYSPGSVTHPEPMSHPGEENALCLEGSVIVTVEGQEFVLSAGDSISFDSGRPHQVENRGNDRAVLISAITPPAF